MVRSTCAALLLIGGSTVALPARADDVVVVPAARVQAAIPAPDAFAPAPSSLFVRFEPGVALAEREETLKRAGVLRTSFESALVPGLLCVTTAPGAAPDVIAALAVAAGVRYAEPNFGAALFAQQTGYGVNIVAPQPVWPTSKGAGVRIAVLDSGVDFSHPDLPTPLAAISFVPGESPADGFGHGSHCSGIALARDNEIGTVGICPECDLLMAKCATNAGGGTYEWIAQAIDWSVANGAHVISMSLGGPDFSQALLDSCDAAQAAGVVLVAAAGNTPDANPNYQAANPSVISVAAVDQNKNRAFFSSIGPTIDLSAPGIDVVSTIPTFRERCNILGQDTFCAQLLNSSTGSMVTAPAVFCGHGDVDDFPPDIAGKIAHVRRGGFADNGQFLFVTLKCFYAEQLGAIGVIVSNNQPGPFDEDLIAVIDVPCVAIRGDAGDALEAASGSMATIDLTQNASTYLPLTGTSMSCPHVAGVAGLLLAAFGPDRLDAALLKQALYLTAEDRGAPGRDDLYGHGIVRADLAKAYLETILPPCAVDFNNDTFVSPEDLDEFITTFFSPAPDNAAADFNKDGFVSPEDLDEFITGYFEGCGG
ncbi:MAG: S8 family serine peptidase [Phycisphaerales bacterium]